jgi:Zn-dependent alcohol dehydrogenase
MTNFNIVFMILDNAGADIFLSACNQSELFKSNNLVINTFEFNSDLEGVDYEQEVRKVRNSYNLESKKIAFIDTGVWSQKAIDEAGIIQKGRLPYLQNNEHWLQGKTALVAGLGPIGLLAALVLRLKGADVLGLDIVDPASPRARLLEQMGGTYIDDKTLDPEAFRKKYPQVNVIIDAAGVAKLDFDLLDLLGINGIFVLTGVPGDQRQLNVDGAKLMRKLVLKNQVMLGSVNESIHHFENGLLDLEEANTKWPGLVKKFISEKIPYNSFEKAFSHHTPDEIKVVIEWSSL